MNDDILKIEINVKFMNEDILKIEINVKFINEDMLGNLNKCEINASSPPPFVLLCRYL